MVVLYVVADPAFCVYQIRHSLFIHVGAFAHAVHHARAQLLSHNNKYCVLANVFADNLKSSDHVARVDCS